MLTESVEFGVMYQLLESVGFEETLSRDEAHSLYVYLRTLKAESHIVEIGCQLGRSSTLLMALAKSCRHRITFIDPWDGDVYAYKHEGEFMAQAWWMRMRIFGYPFTLHCCKTEQIDPRQAPKNIDFLYIDGDHSEKGLEIDCGLIHDVVPGGYVAFHDYGCYDVTKVVDRYLESGVLQKRSWNNHMMITEKSK